MAFGTTTPRNATTDAAFHAFFEQRHRELSRLAYLLTGEADAADDLAAEALLEVWRHWDRVNAADSPAAYARGVLANLCRNRIRRLTRERAGLRGWGALWRDRESVDAADVPAVVDVRGALRRLPHRRRACVVLRYAFDLSERETAAALGISVGTVKSQTSRGAAQLAELLAGRPEAQWLVAAGEEG
ncbi:SigE family RNA polymerase sigma factor [Streptacidiphilus sp. EB103A]|uniref:SigE family RNA polymerase sigma factor n=1 Tax=Streptacidiphilus sp. EB103A TaxID=3156275 RepID=UPI003515CA4F